MVEWRMDTSDLESDNPPAPAPSPEQDDRKDDDDPETNNFPERASKRGDRLDAENAERHQSSFAMVAVHCGNKTKS
jgi:hypothetical protein